MRSFLERFRTSEVRNNPFKNFWYSILEENFIWDEYFRNIEYYHDQANSKDLKYRLVMGLTGLFNKMLDGRY